MCASALLKLCFLLAYSFMRTLSVSLNTGNFFSYSYTLKSLYYFHRFIVIPLYSRVNPLSLVEIILHVVRQMTGKLLLHIIIFLKTNFRLKFWSWEWYTVTFNKVVAADPLTLLGKNIYIFSLLCVLTVAWLWNTYIKYGRGVFVLCRPFQI